MAERNNPIRRLLKKDKDAMLPACIVKNGWGGVGIALYLPQNLSDVWHAGDVIIFWRDGDVTVEDGLTAGDILIKDLWKHL